jgi:hypothetical protein
MERGWTQKFWNHPHRGENVMHREFWGTLIGVVSGEEGCRRWGL